MGKKIPSTCCPAWRTSVEETENDDLRWKKDPTTPSKRHSLLQNPNCNQEQYANPTYPFLLEPTDYWLQHICNQYSRRLPFFNFFQIPNFRTKRTNVARHILTTCCKPHFCAEIVLFEKCLKNVN